jgi:tetratricopeptide (TPR) repeat protein
MTQAREGIAAAPGNPIHYYLAGEAAVGLNNYELADSMWKEAERIYPAYELDIEPARERAWASAFNAGVEAYNGGNPDGAIDTWLNADMIYMYRPDASQNLGVVLTNEQRYDDAIAAYERGIANLDLVPATRVIEAEEQAERDAAKVTMQKELAKLLVFTMKYAEAEVVLRQVIQVSPDDAEAQVNLATALGELGRQDEATAIYTQLLSRSDIPGDQLFNIGVTLFNAGNSADSAEAAPLYQNAARAFGLLTSANPNHRDAWFNQANALYAAADNTMSAQDWGALVPVAQRTLAVDPLTENVALILARAQREQGQNTEALATLNGIETSPVKLNELALQPGVQSTTVRGRVVGATASPGTPIRLRFTFYSYGGTSLGSQELSVTAPAPQAEEPFEVVFAMPADYFSYERLP